MTAEAEEETKMIKVPHGKERLIVEQDDLRITAKIVQESDLGPLMDFLQREDIDMAFKPALSDPARGITIPQRVEKKFKSGHWIIATAHDGKVSRVSGCLAIVPSKLDIEVPPAIPSEGRPISAGISLRGWDISEFREISTVITDPVLRQHQGIKGIGAGLLREATHLVAQEGNEGWGFVTDSWVGGDMSGFLKHMINKAYLERPESKKINAEPGLFDTLVRIYSDPSKRGKDGPPTVVYGIPYTNRDWDFFTSKQEDIALLRRRYQELEEQLK